MKKIVWVYLLGLFCLGHGWAMEQELDSSVDEAVLEKSIDPEENTSQKFSDLVKSTMDLMGPEMDSIETAELESDT